MVKVTFKNVGQGDSILLEWSHHDQPKIAIIDCNLYLDTNPVLEHIKREEYREIDFMVLSHPHLDHFSGFAELLSFCRENNIKVGRFLHTAQTTPDFLKSASRSIEEGSKLYSLFQLLQELVDEDFLEVYAIDDNPDIQIKLGEEFVMEILSPSSREINNYIKSVNYPFDEETISHPNANWLATLFKISNGHANILLTSDVETGALRRIGKPRRGRLGKNKVILAQVPHHGSLGNLDKTFWQMRKRYPITPVVISVGKNGYKHPSQEVLNFFNGQANFRVYRTDSDTILHSSKTIRTTSYLDVISKEVPKNIKAGDITIELSEENFTMVEPV